MGAAVSRAWWRRNALALGAVVVLLPVTAAVITGYEWWFANQGKPQIPVTVEAGQVAEFGGATWGPATATIRDADTAEGLPTGAKVIVVEVPVDPGAEPPSCLSPTLTQLEGVAREWNNATADVDWDYDLPTSCSSDATGPFTVSVPFLVPDDVEGPLGIDIGVSGQTPRFLRLVVEP
jgi:hypothetical protein